MSLVTEDYLDLLVGIANDRFKINLDRQQRLQSLLRAKFGSNHNDDWEDADERRKRKRAEGLRRKEEVKKDNISSSEDDILLNGEGPTHLAGGD